MPTPTIPAGNLFMNATTYTGTTGVLPVTNGSAGTSFQPDLVWIKVRSTTGSNVLQDSVRGATAYLQSNATSAENTNTANDWFRSFNSNGFTVSSTTTGGTSTSEWNTSGNTYVGWNWKAGGTAVSNTSGTITSSVSANTTSGFSVVTYTGSGAAGSVGHGLGATPAMIITKNRTTAGNSWIVWHKSLTGATSNPTGYIYLDQTAAAATTTNFYNGTAMTSTTFSWFGGNINVNSTSNNYVSYCWSEVAGYSAFGSYTGNGSADGPFVYLGFRPRFFLLKCTSNANSWWIYDTTRSTSNLTYYTLQPDGSGAEEQATIYGIDLLSNGVKIRSSDTRQNGSGYTYIYAAFAENPFKYANAR